jgi:solute carrier family 25 phosphate transporter 23/24/25/41
MFPESPDSQDARVEALWKKLDPQGKGEIDLNGLQRGLKKIDHPLKNAHDMLKDVVKAMDKNGDQVIQYEGRSWTVPQGGGFHACVLPTSVMPRSRAIPNCLVVEFRTFVEHTENELLYLFQSIDRDHNGKLDKGELKEAFRKAGLAVPNSKLNQFFAEVDENHDVSYFSPSSSSFSNSLRVILALTSGGEPWRFLVLNSVPYFTIAGSLRRQ